MFKIAFATLLTSLGLASFSITSSAAEDAWLVLQKAAFAARELNYQGIFVYQNGNQVRSVQITHMNNAGQELTRNMVLDNRVYNKKSPVTQPREVFSQGSDIVIFHPKNDKVIIEKRRGQNLFPAILPVNLKSLRESYTARIGALDYVAGRQAQIIELIPKDAYRYSYKIWADVQFGLLVKMTLLKEDNEALEQITFQELSMLNSQDLNWFQPSIDLTKKYEMEEAVLPNRVNSNWIVAELPPGYVKVDHIEFMVNGKTSPVNQMIFSDGIASVSLFIEPITKGTRPKIGHHLIGTTHICANVIESYQVMVVGEVPLATVQQIANAVSFRKQTALNR
ncbi:MAG: transcriptional regulator [Methylotenera sp.]|nr:MAG: transcriptional regulator [Methylotenera sp.]